MPENAWQCFATSWAIPCRHVVFNDCCFKACGLHSPGAGTVTRRWQEIVWVLAQVVWAERCWDGGSMLRLQRFVLRSHALSKNMTGSVCLLPVTAAMEESFFLRHTVYEHIPM